MASWLTAMPRGMLLKSDGFASSLYDPKGAFPLRRYCAEAGLPYADVGLPVPLETFAAYGLEFQRRYVPELEVADIAAIRRADDGYELTVAGGQSFTARRVVIAVGITHFAWLPPLLQALPAGFVTHSSAWGDLSQLKGRRVAVVGAGASAVDLAAILRESGAQPTLVARARAISFHPPPREPRSLIQRVKQPRSGLGLGWRSRLCTDIPLVFHALPEEMRLRAVRSHLGPAPGWFVREKVEGVVPMRLGVELNSVEVRGGEVRLGLAGPSGNEELVVDRVIGGTGYHVALERLPFLDCALSAEMRTAAGWPVLDRNFQSSAPGVYFVGLASAGSFGPMARFAYGAGFTSRRLSRHLAVRAGHA
jgi:hypothetical protein